MDERSPLDNRSLSHTSREPEGQAWAQIGTKTTALSAKATTLSPPSTSTTAATTTITTTAKSPPPAAGAVSVQSPARLDEDTMSDDGRPLQVVEDAEPERLNEASNSTEEKKDGSGDVASVSGSLDSSKDKSENREGRTVRDRTNSNDPKMIRASR